jgi:dUTP pyrophosphatase
MKVKLLHEDAKVPTKANKSDAGWDLYAIEDVTINGGERKTVKTGISIEIPEGYAGLIWPRSGLAVKKGIDVLAGVIDQGYRGEIMVCLFNSTIPLPLFETPQDENVQVRIKKGDRIAQILFHETYQFKMHAVSELTTSERGGSGFGSSGK